jgi:Alcohol dehydrogenase GroES-like domain
MTGAPNTAVPVKPTRHRGDHDRRHRVSHQRKWCEVAAAPTRDISSASVAIVVHADHDVSVEPVPLRPSTADEAIVQVRYGGICRSDLHYWTHGAAAESILRAPMLLGHEVVGVVTRAAADGSAFRSPGHHCQSRAVPVARAARCTRSLRLMWYREALRSSFGGPLREARLSTRGSGRFRGEWGSGSRTRSRCCR